MSMVPAILVLVALVFGFGFGFAIGDWLFNAKNHRGGERR